MTTRRRVVSSADVHEASRSPGRRLDLAPGDLVTPLARDDAKDLGVTLVVDGAPPAAPEPAGSGNGHAPPATASLEATVRRIVTSMVTETPAPPDHRPVTHVDGRTVELTPFPFPGPDPSMDCRLADVVTADEHGAPMAAGFLSLHAGSFPWTLDYDEVEYVIEGELHIGTEQGTVVGRPGDVLYVPKGTAITFGTPSWAKFLYVTYPADWAGGS